MKFVKVWVLSLLITICVVESYFRCFDPQPSFRWFKYDENSIRWNRGVNDYYFQISDRIFGFTSFNAQGERSEELFSIKPKSGFSRILLLGTSLTLGWPENKGVTDLLPMELEKIGKTQVEVINCSMGNSNLQTLLQTLQTNCYRYEDLDQLILSLPLNGLIDYVAANSFLWGENFINDPNQLFYFLANHPLSGLKLNSNELGVPKLELSASNSQELIRYFNDQNLIYDYFHLGRFFLNRVKYSFLKNEFYLNQFQDYFRKQFQTIPNLQVTERILKRIQAVLLERPSKKNTQIFVALTPTYSGLMLNKAFRDQVKNSLLLDGFYGPQMKESSFFISRHFHGDVDAYLEEYNKRIMQFKELASKSGIKVVDLSTAFDLGHLEKYFLEDRYHYTMEGHRALAAALAKSIQNP